MKDTFTLIFGYGRNHRVKLTDILYKLWINRYLILKWECAGIIIGLIICFSIPKEYTTKMQLALEKNNNQGNLSIDTESILSQLMDLSISQDAYSENLYALLISSPQFCHELLDMRIPQSEKYGNSTTLRQYLDEEQKYPWWNYILNFPNKIANSFIKNKEDLVEGTPYMPSVRDIELIEELQNHFSLSQIESTGIMEMEVELQNPYLAALLADSICVRLNRHINDYRCAKAIAKYQYSDSIYNDLKRKFHIAQQNYADFLDRNHKISHESDKTTEERLKTEKNIAYKLYAYSVLQRQADYNNMVLNKPIYYVIQPSYIAVKASSPKKLVILCYCIFLSAFFPCLWVIFFKNKYKAALI